MVFKRKEIRVGAFIHSVRSTFFHPFLDSWYLNPNPCSFLYHSCSIISPIYISSLDDHLFAELAFILVLSQSILVHSNQFTIPIGKMSTNNNSAQPLKAKSFHSRSRRSKTALASLMSHLTSAQPRPPLQNNNHPSNISLEEVHDLTTGPLNITHCSSILF